MITFSGTAFSGTAGVGEDCLEQTGEAVRIAQPRMRMRAAASLDIGNRLSSVGYGADCDDLTPNEGESSTRSVEGKPHVACGRTKGKGASRKRFSWRGSNLLVAFRG